MAWGFESPLPHSECRPALDRRAVPCRRYEVYGDEEGDSHLPQELADALRAAAREDGVPLSRLLASAAERELRRRSGPRPLPGWQAEHGVFTAGELAAVRAESATATSPLRTLT